MNKPNTALAVIATLALAACGNPYELQDVDALKSSGSTTTTTRKSKTSTATTTYALKTTDARSASPVWKTSFPIYSTYDVFFALEITGSLSGHHTETVFVNMPGGSTYQRFDVAFATDVAANPGEQQAEKTATGWRVWVSMPVAGTMIDSMGLAGTWSATAYLDGASTANASAQFELY